MGKTSLYNIFLQSGILGKKSRRKTRLHKSVFIDKDIGILLWYFTAFEKVMMNEHPSTMETTSLPGCKINTVCRNTQR